MDHLFHKNILQEKHNLEWQLAEANAKIEQLKRKLSSLEEKKQDEDDDIPWNDDDAPVQPEQLPDGRWISPKPWPRLPPLTPWVAPWLDDDWMGPWWYKHPDVGPGGFGEEPPPPTLASLGGATPTLAERAAAVSRKKI
jgi:hypothetical protein